jgi:hypothetical protein
MKKLSLIFASMFFLQSSTHATTIAASVCILILEAQKRDALLKQQRQTPTLEQENSSVHDEKEESNENESSEN